jgi:hypothetical protein
MRRDPIGLDLQDLWGSSFRGYCDSSCSLSREIPDTPTQWLMSTRKASGRALCPSCLKYGTRFGRKSDPLEKLARNADLLFDVRLAKDSNSR